jgi:hypothetical protein
VCFEQAAHPSKVFFPIDPTPLTGADGVTAAQRLARHVRRSRRRVEGEENRPRPIRAADGSRAEPGGSRAEPGGSRAEPGGSRAEPGGSRAEPGLLRIA